MSAKSQEAVETSATNIATDRRVVMEQGQAIVDSLVQANDDKVVQAALAPTLAAWSQMVKTGNLNLVEVVDMGTKLQQSVAKSQVKIGEQQEKFLDGGMAFFTEMLKDNKLNIELVEDITDRAFDSTERALEVVASVKTGDFEDLSKTVMLFALAAMALTVFATRK